MKKLSVVFLLLLSFWLRLHALLQLPGFIDEGNHLRWASEVWQGRWVFPLASGKPLLIYYLALFLPFPAPLWLGRAASVLTGVVVLSGLYALGRKWNHRTGVFALLCYALMPWTFFHERLAVADSLVAACAVVMMVAAFRYVKQFSCVTSVVLVVSMIALPLAKLSAATLLVMPLIVVLVNRRDTIYRISTWIPYLLTILVLGVVLGYANLRYGVAAEITMRAGFERMSFIDWVWRNLIDLWDWSKVYSLYATYFLLTGIVVAIAVSIRRKDYWILLIAFIISSGTYIFAPSTSYPRYYLPALAFGCLLAICGVIEIWKTTPQYKRNREDRRSIMNTLFLGIALPFLTALQFAFFVGQAYVEPVKLSLPIVDRQQHITLWSSGYGLREAGQYVSEQSWREAESSVVYVSDLAGMVTARLYWTGNGKMLTLWDATLGASVEEVQDRVASGKPTFLIVDTDHFKANFVGLKVNPYELVRFPRPFEGKSVIVYRLKYEEFQFPKE